jgi:hypothetical protein
MTDARTVPWRQLMAAPPKPTAAPLYLAWCSHEAAEFAVRTWHYSRSLPAGKLIKVGCWEHGRFIGALVFSRGACQNVGRPFRLQQAEVCELTRVALGPHVTPTSRIVAIALKLLRRQSPGLKLCVSFADPAHGHDGRGIYAATNWLYLGETNRESVIRLHGRRLHPRTVTSKYRTRDVRWLRQHVDPAACKVQQPAKHKYAMAFDAELRARLLPLVRPYPKRGRSADSGTAVPTAGGGANPTRPLHHPEAAHE